MPIVVDVRTLPIVRIAYIGDYSDDELTTYLATLQRLFTMPGRKVAVLDVLKGTVATAHQRKRQAAFIERNEDLLRRDFAAAAIVLDSALLRGAVTAIFWMRPLPMPTQIVATVDAALTWLAPYAKECAADSRAASLGRRTSS